MGHLDAAQAHISDAFNHATAFVKDNQVATAVVGAGAGIALFAYLAQRAGKSQKPSSLELSGGSIDRKDVKNKFMDYAASYGTEAGAGIKERERTTELVHVFYNLVTDIYEWGWGQSFHFSPKLPGKDLAASEAAHEARIAAALNLGPGKKCLDVGCGVGGPMRTIAPTSGAHVTGITISDYQVKRCQRHNEKLGVTELCEPTVGNFLEMPFADASYDAAYAIEATCHAAKLEEVYGEIYRVLKPGGLFASYEWVSTKLFDPNNPTHVRIIDEINYGNGLPEMRTYKQAEQAGVSVGFELVTSRDIATASSVAQPWYQRLQRLRASTRHFNHAIVSIVSFLGIAPPGVKDVHKMLLDVADSLVEGGQTGVFSPMHLLVFRKPDATPSEKPAEKAAEKVGKAAEKVEKKAAAATK